MRDEHDGFLKEAGVPLFVTKAMNKGKQVLQGSARASTMSHAKASRAGAHVVRDARKLFGGFAQVSTRGSDAARDAYKATKAKSEAVGRRNAMIGGGLLAAGGAAALASRSSES